MEQKCHLICPGEPLDREAMLVLACARTMIEERVIRQYLQSQLNWERVIHLAMSHGVLALIYRALSTHFEELVPDPILHQMKVYFANNVRNNMLMTKELKELVELFTAHAILAIPYKGLALAHRLTLIAICGKSPISTSLCEKLT